MKRIINIEGMTCGHCAGRVKKELEALDEVKSAEVSSENKRAIIELDKDIAVDKLEMAVEVAGYTPISVQ
ncbi:cation transporter [Clostridium sp. D2Q-11]|uniref:Cation transporter n=1 Tax=Anaeromonas frigoriresistens TaxID=2683708 RepID=A0A942URA6_9FIRM|nr:cation transporter [Anaeromonas frigoriresistens]MBS4537753.1 cation transporter [Anaeromonas frigoriresistens]